jgi:hypothetical protein
MTLRRIVLLAGIINGLGYLVRYTAMVTLVVCLLYLLAMALYRRERRDLWIALVYGLGFLGGALPQLVPSLLVKGNPLYQTQAYHIWIRLYAKSDFVRINWRETPVEITLWKLLWLDPARFAANWWREFTEFWAKLEVPLMDQPLAQLTKAGFLFAVMDKRRLSVEHRALLSFFGVGVVGILSIFNIETRFLLLMAPVFVVCALYLLWRLLPTLHLFGRFYLPINALALVAVLGLLLPTPWELAHTKSSRPGIVETSNMLHVAGAQTGAEILTTELRHQDVASPTRDHFTTLFQLGAPETVADLRRRALDAGYRFVIYHSADGLHYYPEYEELLWPGNRPAGYTPIWTSSVWAEEDDRFAAYRIEPDDPSPQTSSRTDLAGGVSLLGYDLAVSADQPVGTGSRVGVYLYWRATEPLTESLKVFVHLLDPQGNIVAQHDSKPAVWTYDTRDWQPGEVIVDFHCVKVGPVVEDSDYTVVVGLYNENTGVRWPVSDDSGQPARDHIELTQIRFYFTFR